MDYLCNRAGFIWSAIYIVHWDRLFQFNQVEMATFGIVSIDEPLSTRQVMDFHSEVSIISISTFNLRDIRLCSAVAMKYFLGNAFSHFDFCIFGVVTGTGICFSGFCTSGNMVLESHIFDSISKQLLVDSKGMPFTCCPV